MCRPIPTKQIMYVIFKRFTKSIIVIISAYVGYNQLSADVASSTSIIFEKTLYVHTYVYISCIK